MPMQKPTAPGNVKITPVGHTQNGAFGITPDAKVKGRPTQPSPITFGK